VCPNMLMSAQDNAATANFSKLKRNLRKEELT
jgi:hypothetical protein